MQTEVANVDCVKAISNHFLIFLLNIFHVVNTCIYGLQLNKIRSAYKIKLLQMKDVCIMI